MNPSLPKKVKINEIRKSGVNPSLPKKVKINEIRKSGDEPRPSFKSLELSMKGGVKISVKNLQNRIPVNSKKVVKTVQKVLSSEGIKKSGEITLCFVNDAKIKALNLKYLGKNNPTDVIAFDITEPKDKDKILADIAISTERAIDNARTFKTSPLSELYLYIIHGVLHILGYDDKTKMNRLLMRKREEQILKILNLSS